MSDFLRRHVRTHHCAALTAADIDSEIVLMGWVATRRDHGGLIFVDLRDREGLTQIVLNPEIDPKAHELAKHLRTEYAMGVKGVVQRRPAGMENPKLATGEIEIAVNEFEVFSRAATPPFLIEDEVDAGEDVRLRHRYLDLRRPSLQRNLKLRHTVMQAARQYLSEQGFLEVETPFLTKSTPEGARDYLIPARLSPGQFYALPQSPQIFKQLLMVAGFDRYFQIVRCFRDEDLRADRQPEFTQIDIEMSFVTRDQVIAAMEQLIATLWRAGVEVELELPLPQLSYREAIDRYGLDAPDVRFDLELIDVGSVFKETEFKVFRQVLEKGGQIKAINVKGADLSRKDIDVLTELVGIYGAKGLAWIKVAGESEWTSPIVKFFSEGEKAQLKETAGLEVGDLIFFVADKTKVVHEALGHLRKELGRRLNLISEGQNRFVWITDFPLFEYEETEKRFMAVHHLLTAPHPDDIAGLESDPRQVRSLAYDLVLNGHEIGGGSIRIHDTALQKKMFEILQIPPEEAAAKFDFLLEGLKYGAPPHGGIAFGLDRVIMLMVGAESIREVIAFPKTQKASDLMCGAPSLVDSVQLKELGLQVRKT